MKDGEAVTEEGPPPQLRFRRRIGLVASVRELARYRELIRTMAERDVRARYKQAALGFAWALMTPVLLMIVFSLFFKRVARIDTSPAPYALFAFLGLVPWTFFSTSISQGGLSLINNAPLLNKVYCPREIFPLASVAVATMDSIISLVALAAIFAVTGYAPKASALWVPVLLPIQLGWTVGATLLVSAITIYLRDLRHALPILLQVGLFATPVAYGLDKIPQQWQALYSLLNPLAPVIDGYRRCVLYGQAPDWPLVGLGAGAALVMLLVGYTMFKRLETGIADVA